MLRVLVRLSRARESKADFLDPNYWRETVYERWIFDSPKLFDVCALYGFRQIKSQIPRLSPQTHTPPLPPTPPNPPSQPPSHPPCTFNTCQHTPRVASGTRANSTPHVSPPPRFFSTSSNGGLCRRLLSAVCTGQPKYLDDLEETLRASAEALAQLSGADPTERLAAEGSTALEVPFFF